LLGSPSVLYGNTDPSTVNNDPSIVWNIINEACMKNDHMVTTGTSFDASLESWFNSYGLFMGHAYSILGAY